MSWLFRECRATRPVLREKDRAYYLVAASEYRIRQDSICIYSAFLVECLGVSLARNRLEEVSLKLKSSEKKEKSEVELIVEVEPDELEAAVNKAFHKSKGRISVPGFRKGKAPRKMIEKMYGKEIFLSDALDDMLPEVLSFAMKETEHDVVGYPKVSDVDLNEDKTQVSFIIIAALQPEVVVKKYKGLSAPKPSVDVPDSEIENEITAVRARNARIEKADRAAKNGDIAVIDFEGFVDNVAFEGGKGENYELELGSGQFIPGFEDKVEGMVVGEQRDIDLVFPEQYKEDLAGKPVIFKVKLNEVKEKSLPDLDDEFAKDVSEFDTLKEYRADIKDRIVKARQQEVDEAFENLLIEQITDEMEVEVPDAMIEEQYENQMNNLTRQISAYGMQPAQYMQMLGVTPEVFKERMRESSEKQVKAALALGKIAELEGIKVSDDEIEEEYKVGAERYKMEVEKLKETVERKDIERDLKLRAAAKLIIDSAKIEAPKEKAADKSKAKETEAKPTDKKPAAKKTAADKAAPKTAKKKTKEE